MQHADNQALAINATGSVQQQDQRPAMISDTNSQSSTSSPKSQKTSLDPNVSQVSESTLAGGAANELTPPSSVTSSQEQHELDKQTTNGPRVSGVQVSSTVTGRKRTASGEVKDMTQQEKDSALPNDIRHVRDLTALPQASLGNTCTPLGLRSSTNVPELSQQLKTKLTYAMVKVQNGWQKHSLDEIESIASQSPRSNLSGVAAREYQSMVSPRVALAASKRHNSGSSHSSNQSLRQQPTTGHIPVVQNVTASPRKALAPPAPIVSGNRRRPTPNATLQINSSLKPSARPIRPTPTQRTPSQNAAMEADAVETLLFMSASPNNSGHFPSHLSAYSPTSQVFSAQPSPMKAHFSPNNNRDYAALNAYSPRSPRRFTRYESKAALIDRLLNDLDDDESEELDRAVKIIEQHHATKLST